jgi:hypothetical protein
VGQQFRDWARYWQESLDRELRRAP